VGDSALAVEFGDKIDEEINLQVRALAQVLAEEEIQGLGETVITYRSLLVHYDPWQWNYADLSSIVRERIKKTRHLPTVDSRLVEIPTLYGGVFGPDLETVAKYNALTVEEVIQFHSGVEYPVYMLGFTPGFPYLGGVPAAIATPRLETPRASVPAGSVGIAGQQTGIYPIESPGGWQIIGRTPLRLFDPHRIPPTLLAPGDRVRFVPIAPEELAHGS